MSFLASFLTFWIAPFTLIRRHYSILKNTTLVDIKHVYAGSLLGSFWIILGPLFLLSIYAFIYTIVLKVRPSDLDTLPYVLFIFCGLIPFLSFSSGIIQGTTCLSANKQLLLNTVFPAELLAVKTVIANSVVLFVGMIVVIIASFFIVEPNYYLLFVPIVVLLQLMFMIGLSWILSLANLLAKDIQQFLTYIMTLLMIISPIAYTTAMIPNSMKLVIYLNPLSYYVLFFQQLVVYGTFPEPFIAVTCFIQSLLIFSLGFSVFQRGKKVFYDFA